MFKETHGKHPIIVLKDTKSSDLEYLLDYMYLGEVNVPQTRLSSLINVAECLKIRGLAVPDEPVEIINSISNFKRSLKQTFSPKAKRRRETSSNKLESCSPKSGQNSSCALSPNKPSNQPSRTLVDEFPASDSHIMSDDIRNDGEEPHGNDRCKQEFLQVS